MIHYLRIFISRVFIVSLLASSAQDLQSGLLNEPIKIQRISSPVKLDGLINEAAWHGIKSLPLLMRAPNYGSEPSECTKFLLAYDDDYLYAAGLFFDSEPSKMQAASLKRDVWTYTADQMGIILDTFNDNENGLIFMTTPAGTRTDLNILNDALEAPFKNLNISWNALWDVATIRNDEGWFVEMRIPFSSLRFEKIDGHTVMGITAYRYIARKFEMNIFPLIPEKHGLWGFVMPSQTQEILFEGIKSHNPLYITPYLLAGSGQSYALNDSKTAYIRTDHFEHELGMDVKYGLTKNLTLDVTVNTDFAQVEADDQMINLTRYSLFFPEKRVFFQERSGNFDFRYEDYNRLFYSRRIGIHQGKRVPIYGGVRVVGRAGAWDIGFLNMQTEKSEELTSENFNVLRLRRQVINPYSYIGGMITSRIGGSNSWNTAYGLDGIFRLFGDDYLILKWAQSFENNKQNQIASLEPSKIYVNWNRRSDKGLGYNLIFSRSGDNYNPGIGYERRNNFTRLGNNIQYGWFPGKESQLQNHNVYLEGLVFIRNNDGTIESSNISAGWQFRTKPGSSGFISIKQYGEDVTELFSLSDNADIPTGQYRFHSIKGQYSTPSGSPYSLITDVEAGSFYDGRRIMIMLSPYANISDYLQIEGMYQLNLVKFTVRKQEFTSHIGRIKILAFLNNKLSLISFFQYNSANDKIITNVRFRYNPREGNDFYIVYDEGFNTDRHRQMPVLPRTSNRTVLLKYSYMFNL